MALEDQDDVGFDYCNPTNGEIESGERQGRRARKESFMESMGLFFRPSGPTQELVVALVVSALRASEGFGIAVRWLTPPAIHNMPKRKVQLNAGDLILNLPFQELSRCWSYDRKHRIFTEIHGRRPAGCVVATPEAQGFDDPGQFIESDLANLITLASKSCMCSEAQFESIDPIS